MRVRVRVSELHREAHLLAPRGGGEADRVDVEVEGGGDAVDELLAHLVRGRVRLRVRLRGRVRSAPCARRPRG